jgi:hypothetical protein
VIAEWVLATLLAVVEWLFDLLPDGPDVADATLPSSLKIPVPAYLVGPLNSSAVATCLQLAAALIVWDIGRELVRVVSRLILGARGQL